MRCDVKSGVGKEDRHTTRHHWSGISATEEEQADVQAGSQKRHDDRSQTSILSHRLETGHQQQRGGGQLWQGPSTNSNYKGCCTLWDALQTEGSIICTDKTEVYDDVQNAAASCNCGK